MKWYFACNENSSHFFPLIEAAVNSAIKNTTLKPYFIFDGKECELTKKLREKGVEIIFYRSSFYEALKNHYDERGLGIASGAFLRCDIPIIEQEDDFVLYTDCDVLFLKDFELDLKPEFFACAPQSGKKNFSHFNTGVMLMNVKKLRESHAQFCKFIENNLDDMFVFDQSAYQIFYSGKSTKLPIIFNHKPYWGVDRSAVILHFHGAKPTVFASDEMIEKLDDSSLTLFKKNPKAYEFYLNLFKEFYPEIEYVENSIQKLIDKEFSAPQPAPTKLYVKIKNKLKKTMMKIVNKFNNKAIFK